jgi:hypothetical protein
MGLQDRDYMRRRTHEPQRRVAKTHRRPWLLIAGCVLAVVSVATWLGRDVPPPISAGTPRAGLLAPPASAPREGSLVVNINNGLISSSMNCCP